MLSIAAVIIVFAATRLQLVVVPLIALIVASAFRPVVRLLSGKHMPRVKPRSSLAACRGARVPEGRYDRRRTGAVTVRHTSSR
jgi:membrane protein implicated in regulation of membrane protease activity